MVGGKAQDQEVPVIVIAPTDRFVPIERTLEILCRRQPNRIPAARRLSEDQQQSSGPGLEQQPTHVESRSSTRSSPVSSEGNDMGIDEDPPVSGVNATIGAHVTPVQTANAVRNTNVILALPQEVRDIVYGNIRGGPNSRAWCKNITSQMRACRLSAKDVLPFFNKGYADHTFVLNLEPGLGTPVRASDRRTDLLLHEYDELRDLNNVRRVILQHTSFASKNHNASTDDFVGFEDSCDILRHLPQLEELTVRWNSSYNIRPLFATAIAELDALVSLKIEFRTGAWSERHGEFIKEAKRTLKDEEWRYGYEAIRDGMVLWAKRGEMN